MCMISEAYTLKNWIEIVVRNIVSDLINDEDSSVQ